MKAAAPEPLAALNPMHHSTSFELMMETSFLASFLQQMWFERSQFVDVLHSTVDAFGYDLVLQSGNVMRHVQLKTRKLSGKTARFNLSAQLLDLPAAGVVLIEWERPSNSEVMQFHYRRFGGGPGERIPDLGTRPAKHTKGNAQGVKGMRHGLRVVPRSRFVALADMAEVTDRLFGPVGS